MFYQIQVIDVMILCCVDMMILCLFFNYVCFRDHDDYVLQDKIVQC